MRKRWIDDPFVARFSVAFMVLLGVLAIERDVRTDLNVWVMVKYGGCMALAYILAFFESLFPTFKGKSHQ